SIDTRRAATARATLDEGADLINDIAGLGDAGMAELAAGRGVPVCVMHMRGEPGTMQSNTRYDDLLGEVATFLAARAEAGRKAGIADDRILLDPGLGFGKSAAGNEDLLRRTRTLAGLGYPLLVGASRKSFVGARTGVAAADRRLAGSLVAAAAAACGGAAVVRVHDVAATREALAMAAALRPGAGGS
ncbi:dihydropteroate synthase, partial [bacterium]|nr:dihydropteroate synthase [bacterium]